MLKIINSIFATKLTSHLKIKVVIDVHGNFVVEPKEKINW